MNTTTIQKLPLYLEDILEFPNFYYSIDNNNKSVDLTIYKDTDDEEAEVTFKFLKDKKYTCLTDYGIYICDEFPLLDENLFMLLMIDFLAN